MQQGSVLKNYVGDDIAEKKERVRKKNYVAEKALGKDTASRHRTDRAARHTFLRSFRDPQIHEVR